MLTTDLYLSPRIRMNGAVPPICFYTSVAWTGTASRFEHSGCVCLSFLILLLLKCNPEFLPVTSVHVCQTLDTDGNKYEHRCFQEYDTAHIGVSVTEETGFSETFVFICPTTASHPVSSSLHSAQILVPFYIIWYVYCGFIYRRATS
jgi:hypothetical protein